RAGVPSRRGRYGEGVSASRQHFILFFMLLGGILQGRGTFSALVVAAAAATMPSGLPESKRELWTRARRRGILWPSVALIAGLLCSAGRCGSLPLRQLVPALVVAADKAEHEHDESDHGKPHPASLLPLRVAVALVLTQRLLDVVDHLARLRVGDRLRVSIVFP